MPIILLIRHGENDYVKKSRMAGRLPGVHLNDHGEAQAKALAEKLGAAPIKTLYSSPLERAMETATPLAKALKLEIQVRPGLIETDIGEWSGLSWKSMRRLKVWRTVQLAPSLFRFPGGESFAETQHRICKEIETICYEHEPKDIIACVSHADPIKLAITYFLGVPLDLFQRMQISTASISLLHMGEFGAQLVALNLNADGSIPLPKA